MIQSLIKNNRHNSGITHLLLITVVACWPVILWYINRMQDGSDDNWGLLALTTALFIAFYQPVPHYAVKKKPNPLLLNLLISLYLLTVMLAMQPMIKAISAMSIFALLLSYQRSNTAFDFSLWGLLLLSLPLFASLQFYCGYPLRYLVATASSALLHLQGLDVHQQGVSLLWNNKTVLIDGPCSGIKMLWTGSYLVLCFNACFKPGLRQQFILGLTAFVIIIFANILRSTSLFYLESGFLKIADPQGLLHGATGLASYLIAVILILAAGIRLITPEQMSPDRCKHA